MAQRKTIAIVGATEKRGSSIARNLSKGNYRLLLMSDDVEKLDALKRELVDAPAEMEAIACAKEACWEADIIIVTTPYEQEKEVAERIKEVATGKIIISVSNPLDHAYEKLFPSPNNSAAEELQRLLPYSKVVKTFSTAYVENFAAPVVEGQAADTFVAGNNGDAIETVSEMIRDAGFNPFVVGDLSMSRALERMQLLITQKTLTHSRNWDN
ncbi:MAG TPA: NAD(P)-binding domain-containing protein [Cyclobacteriaceae bacterium]|nr:NAD(P)-binding domain-containing protein [Cyclobacteriaceae bacterium]